MSNFLKHYPVPNPDKFLVDPTTGNISTTIGDGATTLLPSFACRAFANFNGTPVSGTYTRTGTLVTVSITAHGLETGMKANLDFTSGTATDGTYVVTVINANSFTITDTASGSTSGNVTANVRIRSTGNISNIVRNSTGDYTLTFITAMPDTNYACVGIPDNSRFLGVTTLLTTSVRIGTYNVASAFDDRVIISVAVFR